MRYRERYVSRPIGAQVGKMRAASLDARQVMPLTDITVRRQHVHEVQQGDVGAVALDKAGKPVLATS